MSLIATKEAEIQELKKRLTPTSVTDTAHKCTECNDTGKVWADDGHHGHAVRIRCTCQN